MKEDSTGSISGRISIQLLSQLEKLEFKAFIHYTQMPGIKQNRKRLDFLRLLAGTAPSQWGKPKFNRELSLKTGKEIHENSPLLNQIIYETSVLLKEFIALKQIRFQPSVEFAVLLDAPIIRGHERAFSTISKDLDDALENNLSRSSEYWRLKALKEDLTRKHYSVHRILKDNTGEYLDFINRFALIERYKYACFATLHQNLQGRRKLEAEEIEELTKIAKSSASALDHPVLKLYSQLFLLIALSEDRPPLEKFTDFMLTCESLLPVEERKEVYLTMAYYINSLINQGYINQLPQLQGAYIDMFRIFKNLAEDRNGPSYHLLRDGEHMGQWRFLNVLSAAFYTGNIDWGKRFLNEGLPFVIGKERGLTEQLANAALSFYQGRYRKALEILGTDQEKADQEIGNRKQPKGKSKTSRITGFEYYEIYALALRAYYLLSETYLFDIAIQNIRAKIQRDLHSTENEKIPNPRVHAYRSFFETLDLMSKWKYNRSSFRGKPGLDDLLKQKQEEFGRVMAHRKWILEQIHLLRF